MKLISQIATIGLSLQLVCAAPAPQGLLNGISNLLSSVVGGGGTTGEVDSYQNAPYTVVQKLDGYEERYYPSSKWVCTRTGGFNSLFGYISGTNSRSKTTFSTIVLILTMTV